MSESTAQTAKPTLVYVCRDGDNVLYVGITGNFAQRQTAHRHRDWWTPTTTMTVDSEHWLRGEAEARERELIRELAPPYNVHHASGPTIYSPRAGREVRSYLVELGATLRSYRDAMCPPVSGNALAKRLRNRRASWGQAKVSLLENGRQYPDEEDLRDWAAETGGDVDELLDLRQTALAHQSADQRTITLRLPAEVWAAAGDDVVGWVLTACQDALRDG